MPRVLAKWRASYPRTTLAAFALEVAAAALVAGDDKGSRDLIEWTCDSIRKNLPPEDFDRDWMAAATALMEGSLDPAFLETHLDHARMFFASDGAWKFAKAFSLEQRNAPNVLASPAPAAVTSVGAANPGRIAGEAARWRDDAMRGLQPLIDLPDVGSEARVRLARLRIDASQPAVALELLDGFEPRTTDAALVYLARLFRGKALERLDRRGDARRAYESALRTKPRAESASLSLAAVAFLDNDLDTADRLATEAATASYAIDTPSFAASSATDDPWIKYWLGDMRNWNALLTAVRAHLK